MRVGLIGFGAIGQELFRAIGQGAAGAVTCPAVLVRNPQRAAAAPAAVGADQDYFLEQRLDAVVECAGHGAVREHGERVLRRGADLLITSVGALTDDTLLARLRKTARDGGRRLVVPSAGIGALDILAAAAVGGLQAVTITVRKNTAAWYGTPAEAAHDLGRLTRAVTLYEGPVREGARLYPGNVNISAAVALAGLGLDRTVLRIVADPGITTHIIEVEAQGAFGRFRFMEDVVPSERNAKTGKIVAMALIKTVRQMASEFVIGG